MTYRLAFALLLVACGRSEPAAPTVYVRGGVIGSATGVAGERLLGDGRAFVEGDWTGEAGAPLLPGCAPLFHVELGDVSSLVSRGGAAPDTALSFSPDGSWLAVGSYRGEILVLDGWTGAVRARRRLAESMIKQVAWAPDGTTLYAAEQSPDANVYALDPEDLSSRWTVRLADRVETSAPPPADDLFGVYTLPAAYGLTVLSDGGLVVSAVHAWNVDDGERKNRSQLLRLSPGGEVTAAWPPEPADITLMHPRIDETGGALVVPVGRSATGPAPVDLPINGVQILALQGLTPRGEITWEPLSPWFASVFLWDGLDVDADRDLVVAGLTDGRLITHHLDGTERNRYDLGTPVEVGALPLAASVGHARLHQGQIVAITSGTTIPYGAADPALRPTAPHPNANALWLFDAELGLRWTWRGPHDVHGVSIQPESQSLIVGAGPRRSDERRDLYGALVFDLERMGSETGGPEVFCATEGPVFFRQAATVDGRIAVAEFPYQVTDGTLHGAYRVTVLR